MERATKAVVFASLLVAMAVQAALVSRLWPPITTLTIAMFGASCAAAVWLGDVALGAILLSTCLVPATFLTSIHVWDASFWLPWLAAIAGAIAPRNLGRTWNVPSAWKPPLIVWALTIAVSWPIVAVRELDFSFETISQQGLSSSSVGGAPATSCGSPAWRASFCSRFSCSTRSP